MTIAIDTSPLKGGHTNRGVGVYTKKLVDALQKYQPAHTYHLFDSSCRAPIQADIVHYPYFDPFFLTLPIYSPFPTIVTVHDLIPILYPQHFPKGIRGSIKWEIQKYSLQRKQRIITDSEWSKKDIHKLTGIGKEKIDVAYLAPSLQKTASPKKFEDFNKQYGIKGNYFLYVGDVNWNKNIPGLMKAFSSFIMNHSSFIQLVLIGKAFLDSTLPETREIDALILELGIGNQIIKTGYVDDEILSSLYTHAQALIQPSFYEGFGFPVLEAMSLGCPVICSSSSSLPEIAGPSIMVNPNDSVSIRSGMEHIRSLPQEQRKQLIEKSIEWSDRFTWQKTAKDTVRSYEKILGRI
jgi:glycosyltransferase involved in cell wall biosynthesis